MQTDSQASQSVRQAGRQETDNIGWAFIWKFAKEVQFNFTLLPIMGKLGNFQHLNRR